MANLIRRNQSGTMEPSRLLDPFEVMRDLLRWDPLAELRPGMGGGLAFAPSVDVKETKEAYVFTADLPGVKENDLEISLTGNRLTLSGKREEERKEEERWFTYERTYGAFSRSFTLPEGVDGEHATAELKEGVLRVTIPKKPESKPRTIALTPGIQGEKAKA